MNENEKMTLVMLKKILSFSIDHQCSMSEGLVMGYVIGIMTAYDIDEISPNVAKFIATTYRTSNKIVSEHYGVDEFYELLLNQK